MDSCINIHSIWKRHYPNFFRCWYVADRVNPNDAVPYNSCKQWQSQIMATRASYQSQRHNNSSSSDKVLLHSLSPVATPATGMAGTVSLSATLSSHWQVIVRCSGLSDGTLNVELWRSMAPSLTGRLVVSHLIQHYPLFLCVLPSLSSWHVWGFSSLPIAPE